MRYWRMAMRDGEGGPDRFPDCKQRGIAALDYYRDKYLKERVVDDCRNLTEDEYNLQWRQRAPRKSARKTSLKLLWTKVNIGDVIYAKTGTMIVGKGAVTSEYDFDPDILKGAKGPNWAHFVRVKWEDSFIPFKFIFIEFRFTLYEIEGTELKNLLSAERAAKLGI